MSDFQDQTRYVKYSHVGLTDEITQYTISLSNYSGNVGREIGYMFLFHIRFYDSSFLINVYEWWSKYALPLKFQKQKLWYFSECVKWIVRKSYMSISFWKYIGKSFNEKILNNYYKYRNICTCNVTWYICRFVHKIYNDKNFILFLSVA